MLFSVGFKWVEVRDLFISYHIILGKSATYPHHFLFIDDAGAEESYDFATSNTDADADADAGSFDFDAEDEDLEDLENFLMSRTLEGAQEGFLNDFDHS